MYNSSRYYGWPNALVSINKTTDDFQEAEKIETKSLPYLLKNGWKISFPADDMGLYSVTGSPLIDLFLNYLVCLFGALVVAVSFIFFKKKLIIKTLLFLVVVAGAISLLSIIAVRGVNSRQVYLERFGLPLQYYFVARENGMGTDGSVPYISEFNTLIFIANTVFWFCISIIATLFYKQKDKKYKIFYLGSLAFFIVLTLSFSYYHSPTETEWGIPEATIPSPITVLPTDKNLDEELITRKRGIIETMYPDLKDFESQKSYENQSVKIVNANNEYYFAYIVYGNDSSVVKATCFRTDNMRAYKTGEFPDAADSFLGYKEIDTKTCKGIR
jgi:hypothetical protein